jgi:PadR family transcriptional regulator, regulatory protein PadR
MARSRRPSPQTVAVIRALAEKPTAWRYGYELCQQLGIKPGSMYPILMRLADRSLLETAWETDPQPGRPPRHLYRLTGPGRTFAANLPPVAAPAQADDSVAPVGLHPGGSRPAWGRP